MSLDHEIIDVQLIESVLADNNIAIFIQNSKTERFSFSDNYNNYAVSQINIEDFFNNSEPMDLIFPDDIPLFLDYCNERKQGADCVSSILRLKMTDGSFQWTRITASFSYDSNGKPYYIIGTLMNVEEQVKITAQLHNVADERDSLLVTVPGGIGIYEFTDCFRTLYINDETARIIGFEKDELMNIIQNDATARFHPDDISPLIQKANETIANGKELFTFDYRLLNKMGNYQWVGVRCRITVQNDQALFYTIMIDKTAEKEAERIAADKKIKAEQDFQNQLRIIDEANDKNLIAKGRSNLSQNRVIYYDNTLKDIDSISTASSHDEAVQELCTTAVLSSDAQTIMSTFNCQILLDKFYKGIFDTVLTYQRKAPHVAILWAEVNYHTCVIPNTDEIMCFVRVYDRTEQIIEHSIINRLTDLEHDFFALVNIEHHQLAIYNIKSDIADTIPTKASNYEEDCKYSVRKLVIAEEQDAVLQNMNLDNIVYHLNENESYSYPFTIEDGHGNRWRKKMQYCYLDDTKRTILFSRSDITALYRDEQAQIQKMNQALADTKKASAAKSDFLSSMSHEIRTPMNAIIGMTRLAADEVADNPTASEYLKSIFMSSKYLLSILNDILDMSRIESGKFELHKDWVSPADVIIPCLDMIRPAMQEKHIHFHTPAALHKISTIEYFVDVMKTKQMLMNLLNNACKFTGEGGEISLSFRNCGYGNGSAVDEIIIKDNGCGMSEEFLTRIFTPFEQEHNMYSGSVQGTGLGLTLSKQIACAMGGDITVESELGVGSTFTIRFPYQYRLKADISVESPSCAEAVNLTGKRILLAEDHPLNITIATKLLEKRGIIVTHVTNGKTAVDTFSSSQPGTFDAILMDIRMPVMDGLQATAAIRALPRQDAQRIPIIAMTANAFAEDIQRSLAAGMNAHLAKPIDPTKVYEALRTYL